MFTILFRVVLCIDWAMVKAHADKVANQKNRLELDPEALRWSPLVGNSVVNSDEDPSMISDGGQADTSINEQKTVNTQNLADSDEENIEDSAPSRSAKKRGKKPAKKGNKKKSKVVENRKTPQVEPKRTRAQPETPESSRAPPTPEPVEVKPERSTGHSSLRRKTQLAVLEEDAEDEEEELNRSSDYLRPRKRRNIEPNTSVKVETTAPDTHKSHRGKAEERKAIPSSKPQPPPAQESNSPTSPVKPKRGRPRKRPRPNIRAVPETIRANEHEDEDDAEVENSLLDIDPVPEQQPVSKSPERKSPVEMEPTIVAPASQAKSSNASDGSSSSDSEEEEEEKRNP